MLQRERSRKVRLEIELEADAFFQSGARRHIRSPSDAGKRRAATKQRATGAPSLRQSRASRVPAHPFSTPCLDEHEKAGLPLRKAAGGPDFQLIPARSLAVWTSTLSRG
jgi:hypothetical protein